MTVNIFFSISAIFSIFYTIAYFVINKIIKPIVPGARLILGKRDIMLASCISLIIVVIGTIKNVNNTAYTGTLSDLPGWTCFFGAVICFLVCWLIYHLAEKLMEVIKTYL